MIDKITKAIKNMVKDQFDATQAMSYKYVVAYKKKSNDSLLGYHADSFCTLTELKINGKRYGSDDLDPKEIAEQMEIIKSNIEYVLSVKESDNGMFDKVHLSTQMKFYPGLKFDDIYLECEFLDENIPKQSIKFTEF